MLTLSPVCVCVFVVCIFLIFRSKKGPDSSHLCGMRRSNYCARRKAVCWFSICISKWRNKVALYSRPVLLPNISLLVHILSDFQTRLGCFWRDFSIEFNVWTSSSCRFLIINGPWNNFVLRATFSTNDYVYLWNFKRLVANSKVEGPKCRFLGLKVAERFFSCIVCLKLSVVWCLGCVAVECTILCAWINKRSSKTM